MDKLNNILVKIMDIYQSDLSNDEKFNKVSILWTDYYKMSYELGETSDFAYQIYLMCENECYKIGQSPVIKVIDIDKVKLVVVHLIEVLEKRELGIDVGISREEAICLLEWSVYNVRSSLQKFGIDINNSSLNGFCEIAQALSIMPFEHLGLAVTKNSASDAFGYQFNHRFGTVIFPIEADNKVMDEGYLLDATYRQFFSSVRCNEGRYYTVEENTGIVANPDPGYFVRDEDFAKKLLADGYIRLNREIASLYGEPFYLASLGIEQVKKNEARKFDYYQAILKNSSDYVVRSGEIEGFDVCFPGCEIKNKKGITI